MSVAQEQTVIIIIIISRYRNGPCLSACVGRDGSERLREKSLHW